MKSVGRWLLVLVVGIALAGCGSSTATTTKSSKKKPKPKAEVAEKKKVPGKTKIGGVFGGIFLDEYRSQLKSSDPEERVRGCQGLAGLGERAVEALPELKEAAARDNSQRVRVEAKKAIAAIEG